MKSPRRLQIGLGLLGALVVTWIIAAIWLHAGAGFGEWLPANSLRGPDETSKLGFALYGQPVGELLFSGARAVIFFGALSVLQSIVVALILGFVLATQSSSSLVHKVIAYLLDVFGAVPGFLLSSAVLYACGPSLWSLVLAFSLGNWDASTRLAWSIGRLVVNRPAYLADTALGYPARRLFWRHYVPETFGPLSAKFCSLLAFFIVFGSSSVIIGVLDPELFPWGALVNQGRHYFDIAPHVFWAGWLLIFASTFCLTLISSGIHLLFERKIPR